MENYQGLMKHVLENGVSRQDRTGIGSKFVSGAKLDWDLSAGFPIPTTRQISFRIAFEETMFFLRGETDTTILEKKNINIWKGNTSREFLDSRGLQHLPVGSIGQGYSHTWRNYNGSEGTQDGVDQIKNLLEGLKNNPNDRRHVVTAWDPSQLSGTPLPPCHLMHMYTVDTSNNKLNSCFIMRSSDLYHGLPYNVMGYSFLNIAFSKLLGYTPGTVTYFGWDAHIYNHQIEAVETQLQRTPYTLPSLTINKKLETFEDLLSLEYTDISVENYVCHPKIFDVPMAV